MTDGVQHQGRPEVASDGRALLEVLEWEADLSLFRSGVVLRQLALVLLVPLGALLAFLVILEWPPDAATWRAVGKVGIIVGGILVVLALLALGVVYGGRYRMSYRMDENGIRAKPVGSTAMRNRLINVALLLSGRPSAMGAGLLAQSRQQESVSWRQVDRAVLEASGSIVLHKGKRVAMVVACPLTGCEPLLIEMRRRISSASASRLNDIS